MEYSMTQLYQVCDFCGEQNHIDEVGGHSEGKTICIRCLPKVENEFVCNECTENFLHTGIPFLCPRCGSGKIMHDYDHTNTMIRELQEAELERLMNKPLVTPSLLLRLSHP